MRNACSTRVDIGVVLLELGAYEEAEPLFRRSLAEAEQMNLFTSIPQVKINLGCALMRVGKLEEGRGLQIEAALGFDSLGHEMMAGVARTYLAWVLREMGQLEEAETAARDAFRLLQESPLRAPALAILAGVQLGQGQPHEALKSAEEAMTVLRALGSLEDGESLVRLAFAETLCRAGDTRAREATLEAHSALLARAARIENAERRRTFLERVDEHARTIALAGQWLGA
jgi:tetratricopeptide (TPR) repeat protein